MKCFRRCLSVLLCCVLLSVAFSATANAETVNVPPYHIYAQEQVCTSTSCMGNLALTFYPNNGTEETRTLKLPATTNASWSGTQIKSNPLHTEAIYSFATDDGTPLLKKEKPAKVNIARIYNSIQINNITAGTYITTANVIGYTVGLSYTDGTYEGINKSNITVKSNIDYKYSSVEFECTPKKDVKSITVTLENDLVNYISSTLSDKYKVDLFLGEYLGDNTHNISIEVQSEEAGLLSGLLGWVQNIFTKLGDGFDNLLGGLTDLWDLMSEGIHNLSTGLTNLWNSIIELPAKLWQLIENGLKNLFVPDEEFLVLYKQDWETLLTERFGGLYQAGDIITDFVECFYNWDEVETITLPEVSLEGVGIPFTFGGYEVSVIPEGNWTKVTAYTKNIINIICTLLVLNTLRKKLDGILGNPDNNVGKE